VGQLYDYSFTVDGIKSIDPNNIKISLINTRKGFLSWLISKIYLGEIENSLPVSPDDVAPEWIDPISPTNEDQFKTSMPEIKGTIKDDLGTINKESIKISYDAELIDGSIKDDVDITDLLAIQTEDMGASYYISGDINPLSEGLYTINFYGEDFAENGAQINRILRIDRSAPVVNILNEDNISTNEALYTLNVEISDHSPVTTTILKNGVIINVTEEKTINLNLNLDEGINYFEVLSTTMSHPKLKFYESAYRSSFTLSPFSCQHYF